MSINGRDCVIIGVDEAGRGPLAGPVVAASVILKKLVFRGRVDDSKKLTPARREEVYKEILDNADVGIGIVDSAEIDRINILNATKIAMERAVTQLNRKDAYVFVDGITPLNLPFRQKTVKKGDSRLISVACASIVAKVTRDRMMDEYQEKYPVYGFAKHKGYGTKEHIDAIKKYGPCDIHRKTFKPVSELCSVVPDEKPL